MGHNTIVGQSHKRIFCVEYSILEWRIASGKEDFNQVLSLRLETYQSFFYL